MWAAIMHPLRDTPSQDLVGLGSNSNPEVAEKYTLLFPGEGFPDANQVYLNWCSNRYLPESAVKTKIRLNQKKQLGTRGGESGERETERERQREKGMLYFLPGTEIFQLSLPLVIKFFITV